MTLSYRYTLIRSEPHVPDNSAMCATCHDLGWVPDPDPGASGYAGPIHKGKYITPCDCEKIKANCITDYVRYNGPVHSWFSLSYAAYFVTPRIVLQGMPIWWQRLFLWLVNMLPHDLPEYYVQRKDTRGRFMKDPFANYRRGNLEELIKQAKDSKQ